MEPLSRARFGWQWIALALTVVFAVACLALVLMQAGRNIYPPLGSTQVRVIVN